MVSVGESSGVPSLGQVGVRWSQQSQVRLDSVQTKWPLFECTEIVDVEDSRADRSICTTLKSGEQVSAGYEKRRESFPQVVSDW